MDATPLENTVTDGGATKAVGGLGGLPFAETPERKLTVPAKPQLLVTAIVDVNVIVPDVGLVAEIMLEVAVRKKSGEGQATTAGMARRIVTVAILSGRKRVSALATVLIVLISHWVQTS